MALVQTWGADQAPVTQRRHRRGRWAPYLLIVPAVALIAMFLVYPISSVLYYSLRSYNVTEPWNNGFIGLENFQHMLFQDPVFWHSLGFTCEWVISEVVLQLFLGLGIALILNETFVGRGFSRALVFSPWAVSGVLTTAIWILLYTPSTGFLRYLYPLGVHPGTALLAGTATVVPATVVAELWRGVPFFAILLLADLQSIPRDLYEAGAVDGAGRWRRFRHITVPHLRDVIVVSTLLRAVWEFNNVDLIYTLTGGGPAGQTTTLPLYVAQLAVDDHNFGYGCALTVFGFAILLLVAILYLRLTKFGQERLGEFR